MSIEIGSAKNGLTNSGLSTFGEGYSFAYGQTFILPDSIVGCISVRAMHLIGCCWMTLTLIHPTRTVVLCGVRGNTS